MNQKTLIGLAIAALIAIVVAITINHSNRPRSEGAEQTPYLAQTLHDHVNDVDKVAITGADDKPIATISRGTEGWSIAEKGGYSADTGKLREFLLKLADAKLIEQKTASKDKYAALGVEDVADKDAKGVQVELGGLEQPVKVIIGTSNARNGTYVRRAGEAQSWLASGSLNVDKKADAWLRKELVDVPATRIASVEITRPDGKTVRIAKQAEGDANFKLGDVPKGREAGSEYAINGLASTIGGLHFDDVLKAQDATPGDKPLKARYATFDGLVVDVTAWEKDGKDYAELVASIDDDQANRHIAAAQTRATADYEAQQKTKSADASKAPDAKSGAAATEPPKPAAVADPAKDREEKLAALQKEVADLNARFKDWTYVLPAYKYASINKSLDDLLKPLADKKDDKKPAAGKKPGAARTPASPPAKRPD